MSTFPKLKTGAVGQYPLVKRLEYRTEVLRFLDGTEQRFRLAAEPLRSWEMSLMLLDEDEGTRLQEFFEDRQGSFGYFEFEDPNGGGGLAECRFGQEDLEVEFEGVSRGRTRIIIREKR